MPLCSSIGPHRCSRCGTDLSKSLQVPHLLLPPHSMRKLQVWKFHSSCPRVSKFLTWSFRMECGGSNKCGTWRLLDRSVPHREHLCGPMELQSGTHWAGAQGWC